MTVLEVDLKIDNFINSWQSLEGGRERSNYQLFLIELTELLGVERPKGSDKTRQDYCFERPVKVTLPPIGTRS